MNHFVVNNFSVDSANLDRSHPHLFPPPRRAGEDEGGGTSNLSKAMSQETTRKPSISRMEPIRFAFGLMTVSTLQPIFTSVR